MISTFSAGTSICRMRSIKFKATTKVQAKIREAQAEKEARPENKKSLKRTEKTLRVSLIVIATMLLKKSVSVWIQLINW